MSDDRECPCGWGREAARCCARFISGAAKPATAEQLMRSRYTAFTQRRFDYLRATQAMPLDVGGPHPTWLGLEVLSTTAGGPMDETGEVEFVARYELDRARGTLHEVSRFERRDGAWIYVRGTHRGR